MEKTMHDDHETPIDVRVENMLTEARVLLPGAQALLGFQLAVMLTKSFAELSTGSQVIHVVALCSTALAVILLMAPAAFHRITFRGRNTEDFHQLGSALVLAAAVPLAGGIVGDLYVAVIKGLYHPVLATLISAAAFAVLLTLWLVHPLVLRARQSR
jgi:ACR3 family arsenite efflux pump ArsB